MTQQPEPISNQPSPLNRLCSIVAFVCDMPMDNLGADTPLAELPHWSSLTFVVLMTAIEHQLGVQPDREQAWQAVTVGDLLTVVDAAKAAPGDNA